LLITSPTQAITGLGSQLSLVLTKDVLDFGTSSTQLTVIPEGQVIDGASLSVTVTSNWQVTVPQVLVAVIVTWVVPALNVEPLPVPELLTGVGVAPVNAKVTVGAGEPDAEVVA
jgi:hypothetical protein